VEAWAMAVATQAAQANPDWVYKENNPLAPVDVEHAAITLGADQVFKLRQAVRRTSQLANQLLALSRADARSAQTQPMQRVDLQQLCEVMLETHLDAASSKDIDLGLDTVEAHATGHAWLLREMLGNLVDNAIRYTPVGGKIDLSVSREKHCAVLTVADSGPGIALQERERIFDPFYRTPGSGPVGSGLGLAIVQAVVQRLDGHITLDFSDVQQGCGLRVAVHFPLPGAL
jgi:two-component system sensor histidine kinase TctE